MELRELRCSRFLQSRSPMVPPPFMICAPPHLVLVVFVYKLYIWRILAIGTIDSAFPFFGDSPATSSRKHWENTVLLFLFILLVVFQRIGLIRNFQQQQPCGALSLKHSLHDEKKYILLVHCRNRGV